MAGMKTGSPNQTAMLSSFSASLGSFTPPSSMELVLPPPIGFPHAWGGHIGGFMIGRAGSHAHTKPMTALGSFLAVKLGNKKRKKPD